MSAASAAHWIRFCQLFSLCLSREGQVSQYSDGLFHIYWTEPKRDSCQSPSQKPQMELAAIKLWFEKSNFFFPISSKLIEQSDMASNKLS